MDSTRRSFIKTLGVVTAGALAAPMLLPTCKECGDRLLIELLSGETELCRACRATRPVMVPVQWEPPWGGTAYYFDQVTQVDPKFTSIEALAQMYEKTNTSVKEALRLVTSEANWFRYYPNAGVGTSVFDGGYEWSVSV